MRTVAERPNIAKCINCAFRSQSYCSAAHGEAFEELARISSIRSYPSGRAIIEQGGEADRVGRVLSGVLKIVKSLPDGRDQIIGLVHPSEFYGRIFAPMSDYSIVAATDVVLCSIERTQFETLLGKYPVFEHQAHLLALHQLDSARERIMLLACQSTIERLASYLALRMLLQMPAGGLGSRRAIVHSPISRRDFAGFLSTTVETVSRNIQALSRAGVIRIVDSGTFEILDYRKLVRYSGQSDDDLNAAALLHSRETATMARVPPIPARQETLIATALQ